MGQIWVRLRKFRGAALVLASSLAMGCASVQRAGVNVVAPALDDTVGKILDMRNATAVKEGIAANVTLVAGITELSPKNVRLLGLTSFLYCAYGLFVEDERPAFAAELYAIGRDYGMRALRLNEDFAAGLDRGEKIPALLHHLDGEVLEPVFWAAVNESLRVLALMAQDPSVLTSLGDVEAMGKWVTDRDEKHFFGVAWLIPAILNALVPEAMGGGRDKSMKYFTKAREATGDKLLLVNYFEAKYYTPLMQEEEAFDKLVEETRSRSSGDLQGGYLLNELAKMKINLLAARKDAYF